MISFNLLFFADNTTIYKSDYGIDNLTTTVRQELNKIYNWLSYVWMSKRHNMVSLVLQISTMKQKVVLK